MMIEIKVGQRIKMVTAHWLRPNAYGCISELYEDGKYLVLFDTRDVANIAVPQLILDEKDFYLVEG